MTIACGISHRNTTHVYKYNSKQPLVRSISEAYMALDVTV
jgi:hypothetical protein